MPVKAQQKGHHSVNCVQCQHCRVGLCLATGLAALSGGHVHELAVGQPLRFWLSTHGRRMTQEEMLKLQGIPLAAFG
eukprot:15401684-Alexandrium_andersonii.AAC.1